MATNTIIEASGDEIAEFTFGDFLETTWDDGGYTSVTLQIDNLNVVEVAQNITTFIEGAGDTVLSDSTQIKVDLSGLLVNIIEGYGVTINSDTNLVFIANEAIAHSSSVLDIESNQILLSSLQADINLSPTIVSGTTSLDIISNEEITHVSSVILPVGTQLNVVMNQPLYPTWRTPYVGCDVITVKTIEEVEIKLRFYSENILLEREEEYIILDVDC